MTTVYKPLFLPPYPRGVVFKWMLMAFMAGSINAGGFMACKRFVTHVTGFGTWFGIEAAEGNWRSAIGMLSVPFYFLIGVVVGAWFTDTRIVKGRTPQFGMVMALEAFLLVVAAIAGYFDLFGYFGSAFVLEKDYTLLVILCCASGLQNAAITTSSGGLMRSTHMTGTTTDLGIGLVRAILGHAEGKQKAKERYRTWLRLGTIVNFCIGSLVGAVLFTTTEYLGFLLPAALALYVGSLGSRALTLPATHQEGAAPSATIKAEPSTPSPGAKSVH